MRAYLKISAVAHICGELDAEDSLARYVMLVAASEQLSRFSGEHAAHDQLDAPSLLHLLRRVVLLHRDHFVASELAWVGLGGLRGLANCDVG